MAEQPTPKRAASAVDGKSPKPRVKRPSTKADSAPELPAPYASASVMAAMPALEATVRPAGETAAKPDHPPLPGSVATSAVPPASEMARRIAEYEALRIEREKAEKAAREAERIAREAQKAAKLTEAVSKVIENCRVEWEEKLCDPQKWYIFSEKKATMRLRVCWLENGKFKDDHDYTNGLCGDFWDRDTIAEMNRQLHLLYPSYTVNVKDTSFSDRHDYNVVFHLELNPITDKSRES